MRNVRIAIGLCLAAILLVVFGGNASAGVPARYVALGDSYSSGVGAGNYTGGSCERSSRAYPALWAAAHGPASFASVACSGATTSDVRSTQVAALDRSVTLVSITAGGNDVGFTSILTTCALHGTSACLAAVDAAEATARRTLPAALDATYAAISARATSARVVVVGYPLFYQLHTFFCLGLSETSRARIDEGIGVVDGLLSAAAARHRFVFADVRQAFVGHQLCSGSKWLHAVDLADIQESYHPTATGQSAGYLPVFTAAAG